MSIKDSYINKRVIFDTKDGLEEKIDLLTTMISKLTPQDDEQGKQFKPKIYQGNKTRTDEKFFMISVTMTKETQNRHRSDNMDRRISFSGRTQCGQDIRTNQTYRGQNYRDEFRRNY